MHSTETHKKYFLSLKEACRALSVSRTTLYKLMAEGAFVKPVKIGRSTRFPADEVLLWVEEKKNARV